MGSRLQTLGMGESQPIANNDNAQGRQKNRRVELRIIPLQS
jgi:outer membrane protein OmpA-like peptidoglycan-associated protein